MVKKNRMAFFDADALSHGGPFTFALLVAGHSPLHRKAQRPAVSEVLKICLLICPKTNSIEVQDNDNIHCLNL